MVKRRKRKVKMERKKRRLNFLSDIYSNDLTNGNVVIWNSGSDIGVVYYVI